MSVSMAVQERVGSMVVPHHAGGARLARQRLAAELHGLLTPSLLSDVVAVVAELLGNAVRHAGPLPGGVIHLAWRVGPAARKESACVLVRVTDGGAEHSPTARVADPDSVDGRGLAIVSALAGRWGVDREGDGQCVWAELGTPRPMAAPGDARLSRREQAS
jgi:anti-sigma regulatory factor (Ser/Thr protein kinase)